MKPEPITHRTNLGESNPPIGQKTFASCVERLARANLSEGLHTLSVLPVPLFENRQSADLMLEFATVLGDEKPVYVGLWSPSAGNECTGATEKIIETLKDKSTQVLWVMQKDGTLIMGCKPNASHLPLKHSILAALNKPLVEKLDSLNQTGDSYESLLDDQKLFNKLATGSPDHVASAGTMWINDLPNRATRELLITNESGHFEPSAVSAQLIESLQENLVRTLGGLDQGKPLKVIYKTYRPGDEA